MLKNTVCLLTLFSLIFHGFDAYSCSAGVRLPFHGHDGIVDRSEAIVLATAREFDRSSGLIMFDSVKVLKGEISAQFEYVFDGFSGDAAEACDFDYSHNDMTFWLDFESNVKVMSTCAGYLRCVNLESDHLVFIGEDLGVLRFQPVADKNSDWWFRFVQDRVSGDERFLIDQKEVLGLFDGVFEFSCIARDWVEVLAGDKVSVDLLEIGSYFNYFGGYCGPDVSAVYVGVYEQGRRSVILTVSDRGEILVPGFPLTPHIQY